MIAGTLSLALVLGGAVSVRSELFAAVLFIDLWLLAFPHVASTFTRIAFDGASAREHRVLLLALPPLVLAATAGATWMGGVVALNSIYFYWQTWHYARQSYGIARAFGRSSGAAAPDRLSDWVVYAFPVWGLLHRAHQHQPAFYGAPFWSPPVPKALVVVAGAFAVAALAAWTWRLARAALRGRPIAANHALFVLSHVVITAVSYVVIPEITRGWLFINVWHNAQYLLFVWAFNARRFQGGIDPERPFLSRLCQPENAARYAAVCLALGTAFYFALRRGTLALTSPALPVFLVCHQAVNFHHYLVDAVIWRSRRARGAGSDRTPRRPSRVPTTARAVGLAVLAGLVAFVARPRPAAAQPELTPRLRIQGGYIHVSNQSSTDEAPDDTWVGIVPELSLFLPGQRARLHVTYSLAASGHTSFGTDVANRLSAVSSFDLSNRSMLLLSSEASETSVTSALATPGATGPTLAAVPSSTSKLLSARLASAVTWDVSQSVRLGAAVDAAFVKIVNTTPVENYFANASFDADRTWKNDIVGVDLRGGFASTHTETPTTTDPAATAVAQLTPDQRIIATSLAPHWRHDFTDTLNSSLRTGVALVVSPDPSTKALVAPSAQGSLLYGRNEASFELSASVGPQANAVTAQLLNAEQASFRVVVPLAVRPPLLLGASVGALHGQILNLRTDVATPPPFDAVIGAVDLGWSPSDIVQLFARYQLFDQISSAQTPTATTTPAALRSIVTVGVQFSARSQRVRIPTHFAQRVDGTDVAR